MSAEHTLRCYDYVNQPFARVQEALKNDAAGIFNAATQSASERAHSLGAQLRVRVGALEVATEVRIDVGSPTSEMSSPWGYEISVFPLEWGSLSNPSLFPKMKAKLRVYPISSRETQLELEGGYDPPLGLLGDALDALVGHRIAEASALRFMQDVAALLRARLAEPARAEA
ncbi:MAG TPA: hypothetical protein VJV78_17170 [Polyangiales bacterium]|nr:hypothetical protein [Polyangiales bacterium]